MEINHGKTIITPEDLAYMFVESGNDEQAKFINIIGREFKKADNRWKKKSSYGSAEMQCCAISDEINQDGKDFIYCLANFLRMKGAGEQRYSEFYLGNTLFGSDLEMDDLALECEEA